MRNASCVDASVIKETESRRAAALLETKKPIKSRCWCWALASVALASFGSFDAHGAEPPAATRLAQLPLRFEANRGQFDSRVAFLSRSSGCSLFLTRDGATLALHGDAKGDGENAAVLEMRIVGGRRVEPVASQRLPGSSNYFVGNDPSKWRTGVDGYARVRYPEVLRGVDVVYYGAAEHRLEYDVVVSPKADPRSVVLAFDGALSTVIGADGAARMSLQGGRQLVQPSPVAYQLDAEGRRQSVAVHYVQSASGLAFAVGNYDDGRELVIDPTLAFSTYLGGLGSDGAFGVAIDGSGEPIVAGTTSSSTFPGASAPQSAFGGGAFDAFVTKLNATGTAIVYSTYLGGSGKDVANGVAVDAAGEAVVVGATSSTNFPTSSPLRGSFAGGAFDAFVTKLSATGAALVYSTYLGGGGNDQAKGVAVDAAGDAFVAGFTFSTNFPVVGALQASNHAASGTGFVTKLNPAGSAFGYSTYLGGSAQDNANGIAIDSAGEAFVVGATLSGDFPLMSPAQSAYGGAGDAFVSKIGAAGSSLLYSTYLGGSANDVANSVAVDGAGEAFVTGNTASVNFPTVSALRATFAGGPQDAFVAKVGASGSSLAYSTYLGGSDADFATSIAVDSAGEAFVVGYTSSLDFPVVSSVQGMSGGLEDVFVTSFNQTGASLVYSTYLGGGDNEQGNWVAVDAAGSAIVVGETASTNLPMVSAIQAAEAGGDDAFVTKLARGSVVGAPAAPALGHKTSLLAALLLLGGAVMSVKDRRRNAG
jgi:hypothetical protein